MITIKNRRLGMALLGIVGSLVALTQCDKGANPEPTPPPPLELLYPNGGESFNVGDTVEIRWSIHDTNLLRDVGLSYSLDGGKTVTGTQLIKFTSSSYPDTTYRWIIEPAQRSDQFVLCIWQYGGCITAYANCPDPHDRSAPFTIHE